HAARLDARPFQRRLDGGLAQVMGRQGAERAVERADRRPGGADNDDVVLHLAKLLLSVELSGYGARCRIARARGRRSGGSLILPAILVAVSGLQLDCWGAVRKDGRHGGRPCPKCIARAGPGTKKWPKKEKNAYSGRDLKLEPARNLMAKSDEPVTIKKYANR